MSIPILSTKIVKISAHIKLKMNTDDKKIPLITEFAIDDHHL